MTRTRLGRQTPRVGGTGAGVVTITEDGQLGRSSTVGGLAVAWTPSSLSTLSLWLDADDAATITQSSGAVSAWNDKSGNAYHVTQATGANQPSYVTAARNGRAAVRFDGTNDLLTGSDALDLLTGGISVMVATATASGATSTILTKTDSGVNANGEWSFAASGSANVYLGGTLVTTGVASNGTQLAGWVLDRSASSTVWLNGTQTETSTGSPFPNTTSYNTATSFVVGSRVTPSASSYMNGDVFEIVASLATWTTAQRQKVEGYLAHRWGLQESLPSDHPYRYLPPLVLA